VEPDGTIRHHPGGYGAYLEWRERRNGNVPASETAETQADADSDRYRSRLSYNEQREFQRLDRVIAEFADRLSQLDAELDGTGSDWQRAEEISTERTRVAGQLEEAESRWLELAERVE
jgi:ATP-binding cassette subfamily F protein uup